MGQRNIRVGALISGGGTNLQAIIDASKASQINADIVFVGTDNPHAKGLARAAAYGIPTFITDYGAIIAQYDNAPGKTDVPPDFDPETALNKQLLFNETSDPQTVRRFLSSRAAAEADMLAKMKPYPFDLLVLAGFMRTLSPYFIDRINLSPDQPRIMNIHPAILPAFPGVDGYGDTFRYGCKVGGCTVHFIDYGEDSGPIIGQRSFAIEPSDTLDTIKEKGLKQEWALYPECIQLFAEGRLKVVNAPGSSSPGMHNKRVVRIFR